MYFGNVCPTGLPLPARLTVGRAPPCPDLKSLLPFQLLPSFGKMDHIHQATIGPAYGVATPLKRKHSSCGVCRLRFNSEMQATSHYSGSKHAKKLKALDVLDSKIKTSEPVAKETTMQSLSSSCPQPCSSNPTTDSLPATCVPEAESAGRVPAGPLRSPADPSLSLRLGPEKEAEADRGVEGSVETEEAKAMRLLYCSLCKVAVNSASQLQAHNCGTKHKTMLEARNGDGAIKSFPRSGVKAKMAAPLETSTGLQNKTFHCEICDVHVNSETQLKQHISSRRHKDRAAGKPAKPKFSPYIPTQRNQGLQAVRLALGKEQDLTKPLASCLLQRHLSAAAAAAMATMSSMSSMSSFHLRSASNSSPAPFQSRPLPQPLLHPATGSISSTHGPVLFSPY